MAFRLLYWLIAGKMTGGSTPKSRNAMGLLSGAILGVQRIITHEAIPRNSTVISMSTAKKRGHWYNTIHRTTSIIIYAYYLEPVG